MRIDGPAFSANPFAIVARDRPASMAMQTILVTGAGPSAQRDGWLIVNSASDVDGGTGSAEVLLDHRCEAAPAA
jgi:CDP-diacylglycerol pyrophosphatase